MDCYETISLFVSLVYCAESTVRWFVVREKHCWMAADSADKSKRTGRIPNRAWVQDNVQTEQFTISLSVSPKMLTVLYQNSSH
jgi:hypothetical protein